MRPLNTLVLLALALALPVPSLGRADDEAPPVKAPPAPSGEKSTGDAPDADAPQDEPSAKSPLGPGQIGDDPVRPFVPAEPTTEADRNRVEARAWFMKGRIQQGRNDFEEALASYEKALDLDPTALEVYRAYVPLAFSLRKNDRAIARAMKLVELDGDDPALMQQLGRELARNGRIGDAIALLEKAKSAPSLNRASANFVSLNRDLSVLYGATGRNEKLAESYEVLFEALVNPDEYELEIEQHAALERDRAIDYEKMGEAFLDTDRVELAVRALSIANERGGNKVGPLNFTLARLQLANKQPRAALVEIDKYLDARLQSKGRPAYELLAEILDTLEESDQLVPRLEKLAEKDGRNNLLLAYLGDEYVDAKRLDDATATYEKVVEENANPLGHVGLAKVARLKGDFAGELDHLTSAFQAGGLGAELQPELEAISKDEATMKGLIAEGRERTQGDAPTLDFVASLILASLAGEADDTDAAIDFHRYALGKADDARKPAVYDDLADKLIEAERYDEAITLLKEAEEKVTEDEQKAQFLYKRSQAEEMAGKTDDALATVAEARKLLPESALLHYQQGWIHYHAGQLDDAVRVFEEVLKEHADETAVTRTVRFSLSNVFVKQKAWKKAEEVLEVVLEENPEDPSVNNDLGYLYADRNHNLEKAERMIRIAVEAEPDNHAYQDSMGWVLYRLGKFEEALPWLLKSAEEPDGPHPTIWDHVADCQLALGRKEEAIATWEKALAAFDDLDRPDPELRETIEKKLRDARK